MYRWDDWFRAGRFRLRRGAEYVCPTEMMEQQVRNEASRRRLSVQITGTADGLDVAVTGVLDPCPN